MKIRRLSRFRKGKEPLTYNSLAIDVSVEELQWLIDNHAKGRGHGICAQSGKTIYGLNVVPQDGPLQLPKIPQREK